MHFSHLQEFSAAPRDVRALFSDAAFLRAAAGALGSGEAEVTVSPEGTMVQARVATPGGLRSIVGATVPVVLTIAWVDASEDGSGTGTFTVTAPGTPVTAKGTTALQATSTGSTLAYEGDLSIPVPILGARLEKEAIPLVVSALDALARAARERLGS